MCAGCNLRYRNLRYHQLFLFSFCDFRLDNCHRYLKFVPHKSLNVVNRQPQFLLSGPLQVTVTAVISVFAIIAGMLIVYLKNTEVIILSKRLKTLYY